MKHIYIAKGAEEYFKELDDHIVAKFTKDMKTLQSRLEASLYQDAWGVTIPQADDINLTLCRSCGVAHQGRCEPRGLLL